MLCWLSAQADMKCCRVADMTSDMLPTCRRHDTSCRQIRARADTTQNDIPCYGRELYNAKMVSVDCVEIHGRNKGIPIGVYIVATRSINKGEEIYVLYGNKGFQYAMPWH